MYTHELKQARTFCSILRVRRHISLQARKRKLLVRGALRKVRHVSHFQKKISAIINLWQIVVITTAKQLVQNIFIGWLHFYQPMRIMLVEPPSAVAVAGRCVHRKIKYGCLKKIVGRILFWSHKPCTIPAKLGSLKWRRPVLPGRGLYLSTGSAPAPSTGPGAYEEW